MNQDAIVAFFQEVHFYFLLTDSNHSLTSRSAAR
jgi:hypothetical protein